MALYPLVWTPCGKALCDSRVNQAIVLTGRPGSGKTMAFGHLLDFLVQTAGPGDGEPPEEQTVT